MKRAAPFAQVVIVPGGWSSARHYTKFRKLLKNAGFSSKIYRRRRPLPSSKIVVTHSVGGLDRWNNIPTKQVIILAPPYFRQKPITGQRIRSRWVTSRKQEANFQRKNKRLIKSLGIPLWALASMPVDPYILRYQYKLLTTDFAEKVIRFAKQNPELPILVIRYRGDVWTDAGLRKAFAGLPNIQLQLHDGPHDDLFYHPKTYVDLIRSLK